MLIKGKTRVALAATAIAGALTAGIVGFSGQAGASTAGTTESFFITGSGTDLHVLAHGAFTAGGTDVSHRKADTLYFGDGTLSVRHPDADATFTYKLNPQTCFATVTGTGSYTLGNGTGAYAHVHGSGTYKLSAQDLLARRPDGRCDFHSDPAVDVEVIRATGPISLG